MATRWLVNLHCMIQYKYAGNQEQKKDKLPNLNMNDEADGDYVAFTFRLILAPVERYGLP